MATYDIIGDIAIIKGENKTKKQKQDIAKTILKNNSIKTVVEKASNVKGRLRKIKTNHILGKKNLITIHKENNALFKLNVETCYFSPRLSNDRKDIANKIKKENNILVMFAGIGIYPIVIYKNKKPKNITTIEISRECTKYFNDNLKINKIPKNRINAIQGDVKKKITTQTVKENLGTFDVIIMTRPNLKETFLSQALLASKKGTKIFYYGFCNIDEIKSLKKNLINEANDLKRKIKIIKTIKAGDIAPYKFRYRIEIKVMK